MKKINWFKLGTFLISISALIIVLLGCVQLKNFNNSKKADFVHRLKTDFFTEQSSTLIVLIDNNLLKFDTISNKKDSIDFGFFSVDTLKINRIKSKLPNLFVKTNYSAYDVDNYILNPLDELGQLYKRNILDIDYIYDGFGYYVESVYENVQIQKYIEWVRADENSKDTFENFDYIYNEIKKYEKKQHSLNK
jgi:hypothetical protein